MIQIFNSPMFGKIRTTEIEGKPMFSGNDVAKALGYANTRDAISKHCKGVVKCDGVSTTINQHGTSTEQKVEMSFIPEGDVYRLAMRSKLPQAEQFQDWVVEEVIPAIRKNGGYMVSRNDETAEQVMARAILIANDTIKRQKEQLEEQSPRVLFAQAVESSQRSCLIAELAKIISQNGVEMGQNRLFIWMRDHGYLCSKGEYYNLPTQRAMEAGLFELKKTTITKPDGSVLVTTTTKVTGRGQIYFVNKFLNNK